MGQMTDRSVQGPAEVAGQDLRAVRKTKKTCKYFRLSGHCFGSSGSSLSKSMT
jgi:hypothetical protein